MAFDSRKLAKSEHTLFLAIPGDIHDGHRYITDCYQKGVRAFLVSQPLPWDVFPEAQFVLVSNTMEALHQIAKFKREALQIPVWAITGSNGKTIVKEWLYQLLQFDQKIGRSPKSYNSQLGVPLSIWELPKDIELAIIEAGISKVNEMSFLQQIIQPTWGILTNIGQAHDAGFTSRKEKLLEKLQLFNDCKTIFFWADQPLVKANITSLYPEKELLSWGYNPEADLSLLVVQYLGDKTIIKATYKGTPYTLTIPFNDEASLHNACLCWLVLLKMGYAHKEIESRLSQLEPIAMRLELREAIQGCTLINDAYNNDLTGLSIALHFLQAQTKQKHKTLILSDIPQAGQSPKILYQDVARLIAPYEITRFIGIGKAIEWIKGYLPETTLAHFYSDTKAFLAHFPFSSLQQEAILLKGARLFEFERIASRLARQNHLTQLEINLNALANNVRVYREKLQKGTKLLAMVKAAGYGSGALEVANLLDFCQVDYLGVAYVDEGVTLRKAGIQRPILVLNVAPNSFDALIRYQLEPEIYSLEQLQGLSSHLRQFPDTPIGIHIKLETGMNRLGFTERELNDLIQALADNPQIKIKSIFSHLAASETKEEDSFSHQQAIAFQKNYQRLINGLGLSGIARHLLNSSGIIRFPEYHFEMVRLGIGLYGVDSSEVIQDQLDTVFRFKSTISQIKEVSPGDTVGYSRMGKINSPGKIAIIAVGYADGLARTLGNNKGEVSIQGKRAPIIGNVCMDMCMVDVSHIPNIHAGEEVEIFGTEITVKEFAKRLGTIPYEVFTSISGRVPRVYVQE